MACTGLIASMIEEQEPETEETSMFLNMPVELVFMILENLDIFTLMKLNAVNSNFSGVTFELAEKYPRTNFPGNQRRPLANALRENNMTSLKYLLAKNWYDLEYPPIFSGISDSSILNRAVKLGNLEAVRLLIKHGAIVKPANLEQALNSGHADILAYLVEKWQGDRKQFNYLKMLSVACERHYTGKQVACLLSSPKIREGLEYRDMYERTCLFKAIKLPLHILELLLQAGANVNAIDYRGQTVLHVLISQVAGLATRALLIPLLHQHGIDVNIQDKEGDTVLHIEMRRYDRQCYLVIKALMVAGADPLLPNLKGQTAIRLAEKRGPKSPEFIKVMQDPSYDIDQDLI